MCGLSEMTCSAANIAEGMANMLCRSVADMIYSSVADTTCSVADMKCSAADMVYYPKYFYHFLVVGGGGQTPKLKRTLFSGCLFEP